MFHPIDNRVVFPGLKVASDYGFDYNKTTEDFGNCTCKPGKGGRVYDVDEGVNGDVKDESVVGCKIVCVRCVCFFLFLFFL